MVTTLEAGLSPHPFEHTALYEPAVVTVIVGVVALVLHFNVEPAAHALAVNTTDCPVHTEPPPVTLGATGLLPTFISNPADKSLSHFPASVHLAVYVPAPVAVCVAPVPNCVVPLNHVNVPVQLLADNVAVSPGHKVVLSHVTVGVTDLLEVTTAAVDGAEVPHSFLHVAV
jgi:hypothetical protein